jgi:HD-like signal output (HDOD) protein
MDLKDFTNTPNKLPGIPKVAQEVIASFSHADVTIEQIATLIEADPVLSAKMLWLANSAYFHVSRSVGTVAQAIQILGFAMVRNLVLGSCVVGAFRQTPGMDLPMFWRYNLYTACAARWLAMRIGSSGDAAFTLGLMHAIGQLQMHAIAPAALASLDQQLNVLDTKRADLETSSLGFHYGDVSAALAKFWNFPDVFVDALGRVTSPLAAPDFYAPAACVHLGAWRARHEVLGSSDAEVLVTYPEAVSNRLGLDAGWVQLPGRAPSSSGESLMPPFSELTSGLEQLFA